MNKVFITFSIGDQYDKLSEVLKESINRFSKYKLIIITINIIHRVNHIK